MTKDLRTDRWTCPNDRNLQLRSKLNAGWSCHTKSALKKDSQLTESELIEIQKVLQRSEMVEKTERNRVSRLVERLENMKRNASQPKKSPNCCALCGDYFSIVRSAQNQCSSCFKVLCSKCCIDTPHAAEDDKWTATSFLTRTTRRNSQYVLSQKNVIYLCRLCSEQREFLKKSGAWFLKKYPSYLNDNNNNKMSNSTSNLNEIEKIPLSATNSFASGSQSTTSSPSYMTKNNKSYIKTEAISPTESLSFRFWKVKDGGGGNNNHLNNNPNENDTFSFISTETDLQQETTSNNDSSNSVATTSDNLVVKSASPASINKKQEFFTFNRNKPNNENNNNSSSSTPTKLNTNTILNNTIKSSASKSIKSISKLLSSFSSEIEDEEKSNTNMANYNYYSNIMSSINAENNKQTKQIDSKIILDKVPIKKNENSINMDETKQTIISQSKFSRNFNPITNLLNSSLSASASNLDYDNGDANIKELNSSKIDNKTINVRSNSQLSIEEQSLQNKCPPNIPVRSLSTKSKKSINMSSILNNSMIGSSTLSKVKPKTSNNFGGNIDKASGNSIAASTSSAVASASILASSLNQLNVNFD